MKYFLQEKKRKISFHPRSSNLFPRKERMETAKQGFPDHHLGVNRVLSSSLSFLLYLVKEKRQNEGNKMMAGVIL
jgi:hypothetical protein